MKKLITIVCLLVCCSLYPFSSNAEQTTSFRSAEFRVESGECGEDARWALVDGKLTISGTGSMRNYAGLSEHAPWYDLKDEITEVVIEPGITTVGNYAFIDCNELKSIVIPDGIESIGVHAFNCCYQLEKVDLPDTVTKLDFAAFYCCSKIAEIHLPEGLTSIGSSAFGGCSQLQSIDIPASLEVIGLDAFESCSSLKDVYYSGSFSDIDEIHFSQGNSSIKISLWHCTDKTDYYKMEHVGECGSNAKWSLVDGELIITGTGSMRNYAGLSEHAPWYDLKDEITDVIIKTGITTIGNYAFIDCNKLKSIVIPDGIESIGVHAFNCCYQLEKVDLPDTVTKLDFAAFYCCSKIAEIHLPEGLTSIGSSAFGGCSKLRSIDIPVSINTIGLDAFEYCSSLTDVFFSGSYSDIYEISIAQGNSSIKKSLWHCTDKTDYYTMAYAGNCGANANWNLLNGKLTISGTGSMRNYAGLSEHAPWYDLKDEITEVVIEPGITTVGNYAFIDCNELKSIVIPDGIESIGVHAFNCCYQLEKVDLPDTVTKLDFAAFYCCSKIAEIHLPEGLTSIGSSAFGGCSQMTKIYMPVTIQTIALDAFEYCNSLSDVYYTGSKTQAEEIAINTGNACLKNASWHYNSFDIDVYGISSKLILPNHLVALEDESFSGISAEVIIIPQGCQSIGQRAFSNNSKLRYVVISASVTHISEDAFSGCGHIVIIGSQSSFAAQYALEHGFGFVIE